MITKKTISECFGNLRKFGYQVYNLNSQKKMIRGLIGFSDFMIMGKGNLFFVEVKLRLTKDKYSPEQLSFKMGIENVADKNPFVFYIKADETNFNLIHEYILTNEFNKLKNL